MRFLTQPIKFFKEYNARRKKKDQITYEEYLQLEENIVLDSAGKINPLKQKGRDRKLATFGNIVLKETKQCNVCGRKLLLIDFPVRYDQNNRIEDICTECETKRKSQYV